MACSNKALEVLLFYMANTARDPFVAENILKDI
jgi:hypothetical protein